MVFKARIELGQYDAELQGSYLIFKLLSKAESQKLTKELVQYTKYSDESVAKNMTPDEIVKLDTDATEILYDVLERNFVSGQVDGADADKKIVQELPVSIVNDILAIIKGGTTKKA